MNRRIARLAIGSAVAALAATAAVVVCAAEPIELSADRYKELRKRIDALAPEEGMRNYKQLKREIQVLTLPQRDAHSDEFKAQRELKTRLHLRFLEAVVSKISPTFNPDDPPSMNVAPPAGTLGIPGMDPAGIKDPKLRREYEEAIRQNSEKAKLFNQQIGLRDYLRTWPEDICVFIRHNFDKDSEVDNRAVQQIIDDELKTNELKELLTDKFKELDKGYIVLPGGGRIHRPEALPGARNK